MPEYEPTNQPGTASEGYDPFAPNPPAPRVFQDKDGRWWIFNPTKPEGQQLTPATVNGQQLVASPDPKNAQIATVNGVPGQIVQDAQGNATFRPLGGAPGAPPPTIHSDAGTLAWNAQAGEFQLIAGTEPRQPNPQIVQSGNVTGRINPDGTFTPIYTNAAGVAKDQAAIDAENRRLQIQADAEARMGRGQDIQGFNSYWANLINASQADEQAQQNSFTRDTRLLYDLPRQQLADENAALQSRYQTAGTIGQYETGRFNAGRGAANDRVMAMLQTLPYRASPQFAQQFAQRRAQEAGGQPLTPYTADAFQFKAPDLNAERQAGYAEAGVTGGVPSFEQLLARSPAFATADPAEIKRIRDQLLFAYQPAPRVGA